MFPIHLRCHIKNELVHIGHLRGRDAAERRYIAWQHRRLLKEAADLEHIPRRAEAYAHAARCAAFLGRVLEAAEQSATETEDTLPLSE